MSETKVLNVEGMHCKGCAMSVKKGLLNVPGVSACEVDLEAKRAQVTGDASLEALLKKIEIMGFRGSLQNENSPS